MEGFAVIYIVVRIGWRSDEFKLLSRDEATFPETSPSPTGDPNAIFEASSSQDIIFSTEGET